MLFNSIDFMIFLPIVYLLYWYVTNKNLKVQNLLLLAASYVFYGWWDWRFLSLIVFSSFIDFFVGKALGKEEDSSKRKLLLCISIVINLGFLMIFKYYNFFAESLVSAFTMFGRPLRVSSLNIILPVGISFYTFQTLSYSIDVYKRKLKPTNDLVAFFAFVSFFPQLVAGPIERATNLLPQFYKKRTFEYDKSVDGLRQILWGLFKKIVIADNCATYANAIFNDSDRFTGSTLFLGALFFTFQIYGDFSGYSDIAIGTSRLFGFNLKRNFAFPYFSRDIAEFWRRWHISLSTWFRDYLYIPLGGSRVGTWKMLRNVMIVFLVSGFWHGASWTFIAWGAANALMIMPLFFMAKNRLNLGIVAQNRYLPTFKEFMQVFSTFILTCLTWIFFRADSITHAFSIFKTIFSKTLFTVPNYPDASKSLIIIMMVGIFVVIEWIGRHQEYAIEKLGYNWEKVFRYTAYYIIVGAIFWFGGQEQNFIYFQF